MKKSPIYVYQVSKYNGSEILKFVPDQLITKTQIM